MQGVAKQLARDSSNEGDERGVVHIAPGQMLPASRVVQLIPKIAVAAVPQKMHQACRDCKTNGDGPIGFKPSSTIQTQRRHRTERPRLFLNDSFPLLKTKKIHHLKLLKTNAGSIFFQNGLPDCENDRQEL